jgi:hypothetical protein
VKKTDRTALTGRRGRKNVRFDDLEPLDRPQITGPIPYTGCDGCGDPVPPQPPDQCNGMDVLRYPVTIHGTADPGSAVFAYYEGDEYDGLPLGWASAAKDGTYTLEMKNHFPDGQNCIVVVQHTPNLQDDSPPSKPYCFWSGPCTEIEWPCVQPVYEDACLRFSPDLDWQHGCLAYRDADGKWVYGVLRRMENC